MRNKIKTDKDRNTLRKPAGWDRAMSPKSMIIDHQSEWNGGYNPSDEKKTSISGNDNQLNPLSVKQAEPPSPKPCTCNIRDLMAFGCKCGGI